MVIKPALLIKFAKDKCKCGLPRPSRDQFWVTKLVVKLSR